MANSYILPHLRNKRVSAPGPEASPTQAQKYSNPTPVWNPRERSDDDLYTFHELHSHFWKDEKVLPSTHGTTLHSAAENPEGLSWVLLFNGANPHWNSDGVIFVKSNLDLLPAITTSSSPLLDTSTAANDAYEDEAGEDGGVKLPTRTEVASEMAEEEREHTAVAEKVASRHPQEGVPVDHPSIAMFSQPIRRASRSFKFIGWYKIARLQLIDPESEELVRMLTRKWETVDRYGRVVSRQRDASKWKESMSHRWAVVMMEKDVDAMKKNGVPQIERLEEDNEVPGGSDGKSFNEMLAEMRLKDEGKS